MDSSQLIGRSRQIERVAGVLGSNRPALVIEGEAGVGKSALLDEVRRRAGAEGRVAARYECVEAEQGFPYAALERILRPMDALVSTLPEHQRDAVDIVLGRRAGDAPAVMALGTATMNLLARAGASSQYLLIVDDAQWLDSASGEVLMFVARRLGDGPLSILLCVRLGEPTSVDFAGIERLHLPALDPTSAAELLDVRHPGLSPELRAEVLRWAVGNPLAITELPASLAMRSTTAARPELPLPRRLEQIYAQRLGRLPDHERLGLLLLALDGAEADDVEHELPHHLERARAAGLLGEDSPDGRATFHHPLVRSAVVRSASSDQVRAAHLLLAEARAGNPMRRAHHLAVATTRPDEAAAHLVEDGAEYAIRRGGAAAAVQLLTRAAELSEDTDRRERRLARAAFVATRAGLLEDAASLLGRLDQLSGDLAAPSTVLTDGNLRLFRDGAVVPTHRLVRDTLRRHGHEIDDELLSGLSTLLLSLSMYAADPALWAETEPVIDTYVDRLGPVTLLVRDVGGDLLPHATDARDRVAEAFTLSGHSPLDVTMLTLCAYFVDSLEEHRPFMDRLVQREIASGSLTDVTTLLHLTLLDETARGRWGDAESTYARGLELAAGLGNELFTHLFHAFFAKVLAQRGDVARARELGLAVDRWARPRGLGVLLQHVEAAALAGALTTAAYDAAWVHALGLSSPGSFRPYVHESFRCVLDVVEAGMATGHAEEARRHARAATDDHVREVSPRMDMLGLAALAITDSTTEADRLFMAATGHGAATSFPFDLARISLAHGRWLRRKGDLGRARAALRRATELFEELGSQPWAERASHELALAGAPDDRAADHLGRLTPQELHIAELAASGLSNKQIGAQLYLSPRTIGTHLYRIFPKLGITSRASLRDALRGATGRDPEVP